MTRKLQRRAMAPARSIGVTRPARAILHLIVVLAMVALCAGQTHPNIFEDLGEIFNPPDMRAPPIALTMLIRL